MDHWAFPRDDVDPGREFVADVSSGAMMPTPARLQHSPAATRCGSAATCEAEAGDADDSGGRAEHANLDFDRCIERAGIGGESRGLGTALRRITSIQQICKVVMKPKKQKKTRNPPTCVGSNTLFHSGMLRIALVKFPQEYQSQPAFFSPSHSSISAAVKKVTNSLATPLPLMSKADL
ncbi:hypothetical protein LX36DRAFT_674887 [Colletotrichum falcatum]|nr:hypothetical protein LX36DRAFT_674887 [Colletotrichum falcatum]